MKRNWKTRTDKRDNKEIECIDLHKLIIKIIDIKKRKKIKYF